MATEVARDTLEAIKALPVDSVPVDRVFDGQPPESGFPPLPYPSVRLNGGDYTVTVSTRSEGTLKGVVVSVEWGGPGRVRLETLLLP